MCKTKKILIAAAVALVAFVALLIIATKFDLNITAALSDLKEGQYISSNVFGRFFETVGEMPIYLFCIFSACIVFQNFNRRKNNVIKWIAICLSLVVMVGASAYMLYKIIGYLADHFDFTKKVGTLMDKAGCIAFGAVFAAATVYFSRNIKSSLLNKLLVWAVIVLATAALSQLILQSIKLFAGRARYRTMNALGDFTLFTEWFKFNGSRSPDEAMAALGVASDGFKSFPSGHTAAAEMLITLTVIPSFINKESKGLKITLWCVFGAYTLAVMISRMVMGAHFLSDVLIGAAITVLSFYLCNYLVQLIFRKLVKLPALPEISNVRLCEEENNA